VILSVLAAFFRLLAISDVVLVQVDALLTC
jgi:hypothetical protein